jgi:hypothetical protein
MPKLFKLRIQYFFCITSKKLLWNNTEKDSCNLYKGWITFLSIPMALFIFLCNEEKYPDIRKSIAETKKEIHDIAIPEWQWSCGNTKGIQVGDTILFQRTGKKPHGFFASGVTVAADEQYQLRLTEDKCISFSEAYITEKYGSSYVTLF